MIVLLVGGILANALVLREEIQPTYAPIVAVATSAPAAYRFGPDIELVDYRVTPTRAVGSGSIEVDLSWRAVRSVSELWSVSVAAIGVDGKPLAKVSSWPEGGRAPTISWRPGPVYPDRYVLGPLHGGDQPQLVGIWLNLFDARHPDTPNPPISDARGTAVGNGLLLGQVKLLPASPPVDRPSHPVEASFGSAIDLVGYDADVRGDALSLTFYWRDRMPVRTSYTAFVHVVDASGRIVAQGDGPPRDGAYPTTAWDTGETVTDARTLSLANVPPGTYEVVMGLYDQRTGERLTSTASGLTVADNAVRLLEFHR
jgi:hypothetical protein